MSAKFDRRNFLRSSLSVSAGVLAATTGVVPRAIAASCGLTPPQTPGPFYPGEAHFTPDNDLTQLPGSVKRAAGQVIYVRGKVESQACEPVAGAVVEIWQACSSGRYNNTTDPNTAPLDPNFKYWGEAVTDAAGRYAFKTIIPGAYPADTNWMRPPHIHFKVTKLGFKELVTQMYFAGNEYNDKDLILKDVPHSQWSRVIVDFKPSGEGLEPGSLAGNFDVSIQSVRG